MERKGIILAGGTGSRLYPLTHGISKQALPIYNKPLIYYPLSVLMLTGIKDIAIITNPGEKKIYKKILGNGSKLGIKIRYYIQKKPNGIAEAFKICKNFIKNLPCSLILGDNIFYGHDLTNIFYKINQDKKNASIISYKVKNPEKFGVVKLDKKNNVKKIVEKPKKFLSNLCITGLYFFPSGVTKFVNKLKPSKRGELEIVDLIKIYMKSNSLKNYSFGRGYVWFDTGTHESMFEASSFVRSIETIQKYHVGNIHEIAFRNKWISKNKLISESVKLKNTTYGNYLLNLIKDFN